MSGAAAAALLSSGFGLAVNSYPIGGIFTETIPTGATHLVIEDYGSGGGGSGILGGGGGGAAGYSRKTLTLTPSDWGKTFTATLANAPGAGTSGSSATVVNGTYAASVSLTANGGGGGSNGGPGGSGGTASGGDVNTTGNAGTAGGSGGAGGAGTAGLNGLVAGAGGNGNGAGGVGSGGFIRFTYT